MFNNILHQNQVTTLLADTKALPGALLFSGPDYAGKLTTALELARTLSCAYLEKGAPWGCECSSCKSHRLLDSPNIQILGARYFVQDLGASLDVLKKTQTPAGRFFFIRGIKKLLKRFDPVLWEGEEKRIQKQLKPVAELYELLESFYPGKDLPKDWEKKADKIHKLACDISTAISRDTIPIHMIRKISSWCHTSSTHGPKFVIIENADRMQDAPRNALLKILEEPPRNVYFILLTKRRSAMIPTVLSRVRSFTFVERRGEAIKDVLTRVFREENPAYANLAEYFHVFQAHNPGAMERVKDEILSTLRSDSDWQGLNGFHLSKSRDDQQIILQSLQEYYNQALRSSRIPLTAIEQANREIKEAQNALELYNMSGDMVFRNLFYRLKTIKAFD